MAYRTRNDALTKTGRHRTSAIDKRTTRHVGYRISQSCRAMVECIFGWGKQHGTMRKTKHRGIEAVGTDIMLNLIAYNLIRIPKLIAACATTSDPPSSAPKHLSASDQPLDRQKKTSTSTVLQQTAREKLPT